MLRGISQVDPSARRRRGAIMFVAAAGLIILRLAARVGVLAGVEVGVPLDDPGFQIFYSVLVLALLVEALRNQGRDRWSTWRHEHPVALGAVVVGLLVQVWRVAGGVLVATGSDDILFTTGTTGIRGWAQVVISLAVVAVMTGSFLKLNLGGDLVVEQVTPMMYPEAVINADTLSTLGRCERLKGNMDDALMFYELGLDAARASGDDACLGRSLKHIAELQYVQGKYEDALLTYKEMFDVTQPHWQDDVSAELSDLAQKTAASGDDERAAAIRWEAVLRSGVVDPEQLAACFEGAALQASTDDGGTYAAKLRGVGEAIREAAAKRQQSWAAVNPMYAVAMLNGEVDPALAMKARDEGRRLGPDAAFRLVLDERMIVLDEPGTDEKVILDR